MSAAGHSVKPSAVVILAAGSGARMNDPSLPKVLQPLAGRPLLWHVITAALELQPDHVMVVVGYQREKVISYLEGAGCPVQVAIDDYVNGTGLAFRIGWAALQAAGLASDGVILALCGDTPLCSPQTLRALVTTHLDDGNAVTALSAVFPDPTGRGRIIRDRSGAVTSIVEQGDGTPEQLATTEVTCGNFAFDADVLPELLPNLVPNRKSGELYLTDAVAMLRQRGHRAGAALVPDHRELLGVNDTGQLALVRDVMNERLLEQAPRGGAR